MTYNEELREEYETLEAQYQQLIEEMTDLSGKINAISNRQKDIQKELDNNLH